MPDISTMIAAMGSSLPSLQSMIMILAQLAGLAAIIGSIAGQFSQGRRGQGATPSTIIGLLVGSFLMSLDVVVGVFSTTLFGTAADPQFVENFSPSGEFQRQAMQGLVGIIHVIGWVAVARGLWRWRVGPKQDQPGWFASGLTFVLAGVIAINFYVFADILSATMGSTERSGTENFRFNFGSLP